MVNVYPQRATDINMLHIQKDHKIHNENMKYIEKIIRKYEPTIWAAWGTLILKRPYLINCLNDIADIANKYNCEWINVGEVTKDGHPHHPLYLKGSINSFNLDEYINKVSAETVFSYINIFNNKVEFNFDDFYKALEQAGFIDYQYKSKFRTQPINVDFELRKLKDADLNFTRALITAIIREDHFSNGSFDERLENGEVIKVLKKLRSCYKSSKLATT